MIPRGYIRSSLRFDDKKNENGEDCSNSVTNLGKITDVTHLINTVQHDSNCGFKASAELERKQARSSSAHCERFFWTSQVAALAYYGF